MRHFSPIGSMKPSLIIPSYEFDPEDGAGRSIRSNVMLVRMPFYPVSVSKSTQT